VRFAACCLVAAACSGSKPSGERVDEINALIPAALQSKLAFAAQTITFDEFVGGKATAHTYRFAAPKGWTRRYHDADLSPAGGVGGQTELSLTSSCAPASTGDFSTDVASHGIPCAVRDWTPVVDAQFDEQRGISVAVVKDEKSARRRSMIATIEGTAYARNDEGLGKATLVWVVWWNEGEAEYHSCHVILERELADAAAAFERACQNVTVEY
jgi:hypothetical protein